ncbi:MAG: signal peptidase I [Eubacterium sp.]|nr:signal peptidase I [Eubacterium sp.]
MKKKLNEELKNEEMMDGTEQAQEAEEKKTSLWKELLSWVEIIVVAVLISLFLTKVVLVNALVPSSSMETLISPGDRLFGNRLTYKFKDPERFDVVIFKYPVDEDENYIKRVIGLPGETVTIENAKVYINDSETPLEENYLPEEWVIENDGFVFEVPEDCYLMLGDNRNVSEDARYWAEEAYEQGLADSVEDGESYTYVSRDKILGKAMFTYWPHFQLLSDYEE